MFSESRSKHYGFVMIVKYKTSLAVLVFDGFRKVIEFENDVYLKNDLKTPKSAIDQLNV